MTNLEFYKDEIKNVYALDRYLGDSISKVASRHGYDTEGFVKEGKIIDWLLEEHKEPIKLKQFEYDLLEYYTYVDNSWNGRILHENYAIRYMCDKGYLKNVDLNMTFREVLDNCEVEDR